MLLNKLQNGLSRDEFLNKRLVYIDEAPGRSVEQTPSSEPSPEIRRVDETLNSLRNEIITRFRLPDLKAGDVKIENKQLVFVNKEYQRVYENTLNKPENIIARQKLERLFYIYAKLSDLRERFVQLTEAEKKVLNETLQTIQDSKKMTINSGLSAAMDAFDLISNLDRDNETVISLNEISNQKRLQDYLRTFAFEKGNFSLWFNAQGELLNQPGTTVDLNNLDEGMRVNVSSSKDKSMLLFEYVPSRGDRKKIYVDLTGKNKEGAAAKKEWNTTVVEAKGMEQSVKEQVKRNFEAYFNTFFLVHQPGHAISFEVTQMLAGGFKPITIKMRFTKLSYLEGDAQYRAEYFDQDGMVINTFSMSQEKVVESYKQVFESAREIFISAITNERVELEENETLTGAYDKLLNELNEANFAFLPPSRGPSGTSTETKPTPVDREVASLIRPEVMSQEQIGQQSAKSIAAQAEIDRNYPKRREGLLQSIFSLYQQYGLPENPRLASNLVNQMLVQGVLKKDGNEYVFNNADNPVKLTLNERVRDQLA